jgi:hypothetical protein
MLADQDLAALKGAVELIWRKGTHNPQEAAIAFNFTQLVERLVKEKPSEDKKPEGKGK